MQTPSRQAGLKGLEHFEEIFLPMSQAVMTVKADDGSDHPNEE